MLRIVWDNIAQEGDMAVVYTVHGTALELDTSRSLDTAVLLSLFTDRTSDPDDPIPPSSDKRGFWGDAFPLVDGDRWGSRLWTLSRHKVTVDTLSTAREMCEEALQWMVDDGVVEKVVIQTSWLRNRRGYLAILVQLFKPGQLTPQISGPWEVIYAAS